MSDANNGIFEKSNMTIRSPNATDGANPKHVCNVCNGTTSNDQMVECSSCQQWCHFTCVGVDDAINKYVWLCWNCPELQTKRSNQGNVKVCVRCQKIPKTESMIKCLKCRQIFHRKCSGIERNVMPPETCVKCYQFSTKAQNNTINVNEVDEANQTIGEPSKNDELNPNFDKSSHANKINQTAESGTQENVLPTSIVPTPIPTIVDTSLNAITSHSFGEQQQNDDSLQKPGTSSQTEALQKPSNNLTGSMNKDPSTNANPLHSSGKRSQNDESPQDPGVSSQRGNHNTSTSSSKSSNRNQLARQKLLLLEEEKKLNEKMMANLRERIYLLDNMSSSSQSSSVADDQEENSRTIKNWLDETVNQQAPLDVPKARIGFPQLEVTAGEKSFNRSIGAERRLNMNSTEAVNPRVSSRVNQHQNTSAQQHCMNHNDNTLNLTHLVTRQVVSRKLPEFGGDPIEWPVFITTFRDTTEKCGLSNEENLMRLKASLKGNALEHVRNLLLLPGAVPQVIATLSLKYGEPEEIININLQKIRQQRPFTSEDLNQLVDFALSVQNFCSIVEVMKQFEHLRNPILLREMLAKLPANYKMDWEQFKDEKLKSNGNLLNFKDWIMNIAKYASKAKVSFQTTTNDNSRTTAKKNDRPRKDFAHHAHEKVDDTPTTSKQSQKCEMCEANGHLIDECNKFLQLTKAKRWEFIFDKRLCRRCLRPHAEKRCKSTKRCGVDGCKTRHSHLLHNYKSQRSHPAEPKEAPEEGQNHTVATTRDIESLQRSKVLFHVIPVTLYGPKGSINTFAFLDSGSEITLLSQNTANEIGLEGDEEQLCLKWTNDTIRTVPNSKKVKLQIAGQKQKKRYAISGVRTTDQLSLPVQSVSLDDLNKYEHIRGLPIEPYGDAKPDLLIGLDNWHVAASLEVREGKLSDPIASRTRLGWVTFGVMVASNTNTFFNCHQCECQDDVSLHQMVKEFFNTESVGVSITTKQLESADDVKSKAILENTLKFNGSRYEIGLLWRCENVSLPDSYSMAKRRLECLEKKLLRDPQLRNEYSLQMDSYAKNNYIRKAMPDEFTATARKWYLPTFVVRNPNKPQKLRIVWDAAATVQGVSLNHFLLKGPDLITSLADILGRFRQGKVAITGDLREMFHQVNVQEQDQATQLFLWRDCDVTKEPNVYVMKVLTFGATCSPACAIYVKNTNAQKFYVKYPEAATAIIHNHYVDDWLQSVDDEHSAIALAKQVRKIHEAGGFEIRGWRSNSSNVLKELGETFVIQDRDFEKQEEHVKVLGLWWKPQNDTFCFKFNPERVDKNILSGNRCPTKREALRTLMLIFDPLGLIGFFTVQGKLLLQETWTTKVGWDDPILSAQEKKWCSWVSRIPDICDVEIDRWYGVLSNKVQHLQMHVFVDASILAYASVAYLRTEDEENVHVALLGSKTKVAPLRPMSVPRLELMGAVLGMRHAKTLAEGHSLKIEKTIFWTDSQTVLKWLNSQTKAFNQFVGLRIGEILENTNVNQWRWLSTKFNVADEATKFHFGLGISSTSRWTLGPSFLRESVDNWPESISVTDDDERDEEVKIVAVNNISQTSTVIDATKFSNWNRLLRVHAYAKRYLQNLHLKVKKEQLSLGPLTTSEIEESRDGLIRLAQCQSYAEDIQLLTKDPKARIPKNSRLRKLSPYLDQHNIIRVKGRIDAAPNIPFQQKRPILLPPKHPVTNLILQYYHQKYLHMHHETTLNEINQLYYVRKLRAEMRRIRYVCQFCKNNASKPLAPEMGDLPLSRLASFSLPFTYTGVDLFGPIYVTVTRHVEKRYGGLFTCMTTRAIHIELIESLTTSSFINALRCFINRRGCPKVINCDNATNFKGADKELKIELQGISLTKVKENFQEIDWKYIPTASPHMGGSWERLIGSVKRVLSRVLREQKPRVEILRTALIEVEGIMNSRPLTYVPVDLDAQEAITPNHFLLLSSNGIKPPGVYDDCPRTLEANWRMSQQIADRYWKRWVAEYLPTLITRSKWHDNVSPVEVGDVVVIFEDGVRNSWKKGVVVDVNKGSGDQVRSAVVKTSNGLYTRPATKIAVLKVKSKPSGAGEFTGGSVTAIE